MRKLQVVFVSIIAVIAMLSGCSKQATEEECVEFVMKMDFKAFEKGKCDEYIDW